MKPTGHFLFAIWFSAVKRKLTGIVLHTCEPVFGKSRVLLGSSPVQQGISPCERCSGMIIAFSNAQVNRKANDSGKRLVLTREFLEVLSFSKYCESQKCNRLRF